MAFDDNDVGEYLRLKKLYQENGLQFNPPVGKGSAVALHIITQSRRATAALLNPVNGWRPRTLLGEAPGSFQDGTYPAVYVAREAREIAALLRDAMRPFSIGEYRLASSAIARLMRPNPGSSETPRVVRLFNVLLQDVKQQGLTFDGFDEIDRLCRSTIDLLGEVERRCHESPNVADVPDRNGRVRVPRASGKWHLSADELVAQLLLVAEGLERFAVRHLGAVSSHAQGKADINAVDEENRWLRVSDAAAISGINAGVISKAIDQGNLIGNGEKGRKRRVDGVDFNRWQLDRARRPEVRESDAAVQKRLRNN